MVVRQDHVEAGYWGIAFFIIMGALHELLGKLTATQPTTTYDQSCFTRWGCVLRATTSTVIFTWYET